MELALPAAVRDALSAQGVEPSGPLGVGASGLRWSALGPQGQRYAVVHAAGEPGVRLRSRAQALLAVTHPGLARCAQILSAQDGVVVLVEAEPGTDLGVLLEARGRLEPGEAVGLLAPVAEALATLHAAGLVHGDVSPGNIVVTGGRPVLVDLLGACDPVERGTPGFTPPGREHGASAAGDVASLGLVGLALLGAAEPRPGARSPGTPWDAEQEATDAQREAVLAVCAQAVSAADDSPGAAELADALRRACPPTVLRPADPAVLARLGLRRLSGAEELVDRAAVTVRGSIAGRRRDGRHRSGRGADGRAHRAAGAVGALGMLRARGARPGRRAPWVERGLRLGGLGAALLLAAGVIVLTLVSAQESPAEAAVRLTRERAQALLSRDAAALAEVTVPGSAAALADRAALGALSRPLSAADAGTWELDVAAEAVVPCEEPAACVLVRMVTSSGGTRGEVRRVVLVLEPEPWRVREVSEPG